MRCGILIVYVCRASHPLNPAGIPVEFGNPRVFTLYKNMQWWLKAVKAGVSASRFELTEDIV